MLHVSTQIGVVYFITVIDSNRPVSIVLFNARTQQKPRDTERSYILSVTTLLVEKVKNKILNYMI